MWLSSRGMFKRNLKFYQIHWRIINKHYMRKKNSQPMWNVKILNDTRISISVAMAKNINHHEIKNEEEGSQTTLFFYHNSLHPKTYPSSFQSQNKNITNRKQHRLYTIQEIETKAQTYPTSQWNIEPSKLPLTKYSSWKGCQANAGKKITLISVFTFKIR